MNNLRSKTNFSNQAQSSLIKVNQVIFLSHNTRPCFSPTQQIYHLSFIIYHLLFSILHSAFKEVPFDTRLFPVILTVH